MVLPEQISIFHLASYIRINDRVITNCYTILINPYIHIFQKYQLIEILGLIVVNLPLVIEQFERITTHQGNQWAILVYFTDLNVWVHHYFGCYFRVGFEVQKKET